MQTFNTALKKARRDLGWDQRSLATALRMSDKTIAHLESTGNQSSPAAQDVLDLLEAYGVKFAEDFSRFTNFPAPQDRYFLTLDFRYESKQDERVHILTRRMRVVGMSIVRRLNQARATGSSFDGVELHVPPVNRISLDDVLKRFLEEFGPSVDCLVRNAEGFRLTPQNMPTLWDRGLPTSKSIQI